jgi:signal transduction histidine kinase
VVAKAEVGRIGEKGFRSDAAKRLHVQGQGVGLFNAKRLAQLLGATIDFRPGTKVLFDSSGVPFASFSVLINFPESPV